MFNALDLGYKCYPRLLPSPQLIGYIQKQSFSHHPMPVSRESKANWVMPRACWLLRERKHILARLLFQSFLVSSLSCRLITLLAMLIKRSEFGGLPKHLSLFCLRAQSGRRGNSTVIWGKSFSTEKVLPPLSAVFLLPIMYCKSGNHPTDKSNVNIRAKVSWTVAIIL